MTRYDVSHWTITDGKTGLLLFAQSLEELLAMHSHDSHKVPALNFHYLGYEILSVIDSIEDDVLDRGNLIPLFAEMRTLFQQDQTAQKYLGNDFDAIFYKKNGKGEYDKKPIKIEASKEVDGLLPTLKKGIRFIVSELNRNDQYYHELIQQLKIQITECGEDLLKLDSLYSSTKIIASELINKGYNQSYIYDCIKWTFFSPEHSVSTINILDTFFSYFPASQHDYVVYFPLNSIKQKRALEDYGNFEIAENVYEMFDPSIPYILKYTCTAIDPYRAREEGLQLINFCLSVNQFIKHNKYDYSPKYAEVVNKENKAVTFIKRPETPVFRGYANYTSLEVSDLLDTCLKLNAGVFQVLQLHSAALTSKNTDNQLINLWTAIEVAIPITRKDSLSRINQISNILTSALGRDYFAGLVHQLFLDIASTGDELVKKIEGIDYEGSIEAKLLAILTLQDYNEVHDTLTRELLNSMPILACRMHGYKNKWSTTKSIKNAYQAHSERLSQQIMRIYRTRNMLVHDGTSMPYSDYVLQNLHYYIDSFIRFLSTYYKLGYTSVNTIIDSIQFQEQMYLESLSVDASVNKSNVEKYVLRV